MSIGEMNVLNVGEGDTTLTFDPAQPAERERAAKIITDMLTRGYAILVQVGESVVDGKKEPIYRRARAFDPATCEYIIAGGPDETIEIGEFRDEPAKAKPGRPRRVRDVRIPAEKTRSTAVARRAGG